MKEVEILFQELVACSKLQPDYRRIYRVMGGVFVRCLDLRTRSLRITLSAVRIVSSSSVMSILVIAFLLFDFLINITTIVKQCQLHIIINKNKPNALTIDNNTQITPNKKL